MRVGCLAVVAVLGLAAGGGGAAAMSGGAEPGSADETLYRTCVDELPKELARVEEADGTARDRATGPEGEWWIERHDLDGDGVDEVLLVALPEGRGGEVKLLHRKDDAAEKWEADRIRLEGGSVTRVSVSVSPLGNGESLAHVDAGPGGQALIHWHGGKLKTVWKVGKAREGERRWFVLEDLDGNGVSEVVEYFQRELDDFYADEDDLEEGAVGGSTTRIDAVAVYRLEDGDWKKDRDLLESRRRR